MKRQKENIPEMTFKRESVMTIRQEIAERCIRQTKL